MKQELKAVRDLLLDPKHWVKGVSAIREDKSKVSSRSQYACAFCLTGAIARVVGRDYDLQNVVATELSKALPEFSSISEGDDFGNLQRFNDNPKTTHAEVISLIDKALEQS